MSSLIQLRRDTTSNWASINPILAQGELGIDLNLNRIKIGNGITPWLNLPWMDVSKDQLNLTLLDLGIPDGVDGQVLATNGNGYFHFVDAGGGSSNGPITFSDGTVQTTAYIPPAAPVSEPPYKGFYAVSSRYGGYGKAFYQVIVANTSEQFAYGKRVMNTQNDDFYAEGLSTATVVTMFNLYANTSNDVIPSEAIKSVTEAFIDNVLYDGATPVTDATVAKQRFTDNFVSFSGIVANELEINFQFGGSQISGYNLSGANGSNVFISFEIDSANLNYIYIGHDDSQQIGSFDENEIIVIPGNLLGGVTPDNDMTLTVMTDGNNHYVGVNSISGVAANQYALYPIDSIVDGGSDQYDTGNFIRTNVSGNAISYNGGLPVTSADQIWGPGSSYVVSYNSGVFAMMAFNTAVDMCEYGGSLGYDGAGSVTVERLIGGVFEEVDAVNLGDFVFTANKLSTATIEDLIIEATDDLYLDAKGDDVHLRADDDVRIQAGYDFDTDTYDWQYRFTDGGQLLIGNNDDGVYGTITPELNLNTGSNGAKFEGEVFAKITSNYGNNQWLFDELGNLTLPQNGGDILDYNGVSVLGGGGSSFSGDYNDLTNKPDLSVYATEIYVDNAVASAASSTLVGLSDVSDSLLTNIHLGQQLQWTGTEWTKGWTQILQSLDTVFNADYGIVLKSATAATAYVHLDGGDNFLYNPSTKTVKLEGQALTAAKIQSWDSIVTTAATEAYVDSAIAAIPAPSGGTGLYDLADSNVIQHEVQYAEFDFTAGGQHPSQTVTTRLDGSDLVNGDLLQILSFDVNNRPASENLQTAVWSNGQWTGYATFADVQQISSQYIPGSMATSSESMDYRLTSAGIGAIYFAGDLQQYRLKTSTGWVNMGGSSSSAPESHLIVFDKNNEDIYGNTIQQAVDKLMAGTYDVSSMNPFVLQIDPSTINYPLVIPNRTAFSAVTIRIVGATTPLQTGGSTTPSLAVSFASGITANSIVFEFSDLALTLDTTNVYASNAGIYTVFTNCFISNTVNLLKDSVSVMGLLCIFDNCKFRNSVVLSDATRVPIQASFNDCAFLNVVTYDATNATTLYGVRFYNCVFSSFPSGYPSDFLTKVRLIGNTISQEAPLPSVRTIQLVLSPEYHNSFIDFNVTTAVVNWGISGTSAYRPAKIYVYLSGASGKTTSAYSGPFGSVTFVGGNPTYTSSGGVTGTRDLFECITHNGKDWVITQVAGNIPNSN